MQAAVLRRETLRVRSNVAPRMLRATGPVLRLRLWLSVYGEACLRGCARAHEDGSVLQDTGAVTTTMGCCQTKLAKGANGKVTLRCVFAGVWRRPRRFV